MSNFFTKMWVATLVVLVLWAVDKNLLSKILALSIVLMKQITWAALSIYSSWKSNTTDMIKDGYHVNEAYLYEYCENTTVREIDVLRIFRQHIQLQTFSFKKHIPVVRFIELCCDPHSNFTEYNASARYELVVSYTFDHKDYKIVYGSRLDKVDADNNVIRFPLYTEHAIRNKNLRQTGVLTAATLVMEEDDEDGLDIYPQLKQLAGPMENFYTDTEYSITKSHLQYMGLRVSVDAMFIKMIDLWGTEFVVRPEQDVIKMEK